MEKYKTILIDPQITLEYIYETNKLDFKSIKSNPILKPISEINQSYCDRHIVISKALLEFEEEYKKIQEMEIINPRYTNTALMATIKNIINGLKTVIHNEDLNDSGMKKVILEMVDINGSEYKLMDSEQEKMDKMREQVRKELEKEYKTLEIKKEITKPENYDLIKEAIERGDTTIGNEEDKVISDLKKIAGEKEPDKKEVILIPEKPKKVWSTILEREL